MSIPDRGTVMQRPRGRCGAMGSRNRSLACIEEREARGQRVEEEGL